MEEATRILGIDPGTRFVGYGIVERRANSLQWLASGCIRAEGATIAERLVTIYRGLRQVILLHSPQTAAVETVFTGNNPKTAISIGEGRGVAVLSAAEHGLTVQGYEPALVKRAIAGSDRAGKDQVRDMVRVLLHLPHQPATDHESDALALAITHARHLVTAERTGLDKATRPIRARRRQLPEFIAKQFPPGVL